MVVGLHEPAEEEADVECLVIVGSRSPALKEGVAAVEVLGLSEVPMLGCHRRTELKVRCEPVLVGASALLNSPVAILPADHSCFLLPTCLRLR